MPAHKPCPFCGHENLDHAVYCFNCGNALAAEAPSAGSDQPVIRRTQRIMQAVLLPPSELGDAQPDLPATAEFEALHVEQPLTCLNCGSLNRSEANYCIQCGMALIVPDKHANLLAHASARTDIGRVRENNEDSVGLWALNGVILALVADGMGGAAAGEEASRLTVEAVQADFVGQERGSPELLTLAEEIISEKLAAAIQAANQAVIERVDENTALRGMGTTATLAFVRGSRALLAHVGDSRAYLVDGEQGWISQITSDHSFVEALLAAGHITEDQARNHPMKNVLYRALGQTPDTTADTYDRFLKGGDRIVLCSDGLTRHVPPDEIAELVLQDDNPDAATQRLIDRANARGGEDNISAIVILMEAVPDELYEAEPAQAATAPPAPEPPPSSPVTPLSSDPPVVNTLLLQTIDDLEAVLPPAVPTSPSDDEPTIALTTPSDDEPTLIEELPAVPPPDLPEPIPTQPSDTEATLAHIPPEHDALLREIEAHGESIRAPAESEPPDAEDTVELPVDEPPSDETQADEAADADRA